MPRIAPERSDTRGRAKLDPAAPDDDSQLQIAGGSSLRAPQSGWDIAPPRVLQIVEWSPVRSLKILWQARQAEVQ